MTSKTNDEIERQASDEEPIIALDLDVGTPKSDATKAYFDKCEEKLGMIPNVLKAYSFNDEKFSAFTRMYNDLMLSESGLSKLEREMIAVVVSSENKCHYCLTAHGAAVRTLSGDPALGDILVMNYRAAELSMRHRAMLDFASALTVDPTADYAQDRELLREVGFSEADIWDIISVIGFFNMSNRIAAATEMRPNKAYYSESRS